MNALLGCPLLLPSTSLADVPTQLLCTAINCCTESVNIFSDRVALGLPGKPTLLTHPLASTLICRLIQIASLRFCAHALIERHCNNAVNEAAVQAITKPTWETLATVTYDPALVGVAATAGRHSAYPPSVKRVLLFNPAAVKKTTTGGKKPGKKVASKR